MVCVARRNSVTRDDTFVSFASSSSRSKRRKRRLRHVEDSRPQYALRLMPHDLRCDNFQRAHLPFFASQPDNDGIDGLQSALDMCRISDTGSADPAPDRVHDGGDGHNSPSDGGSCGPEGPDGLEGPKGPGGPRYDPLTVDNIRSHNATNGAVRVFRANTLKAYCRLASAVAAENLMHNYAFWLGLEAYVAGSRPPYAAQQRDTASTHAGTEAKTATDRLSGATAAACEFAAQPYAQTRPVLGANMVPPHLLHPAHCPPILTSCTALGPRTLERLQPAAFRRVRESRYAMDIRPPELGSDGRAVRVPKAARNQLVVDFPAEPRANDNFEGLFSCGRLDCDEDEVAVVLEYATHSAGRGAGAAVSTATAEEAERRRKRVFRAVLRRHGRQSGAGVPGWVTLLQGGISEEISMEESGGRWGGRTFGEWGDYVYTCEESYLRLLKS